MVTMKTLFLLLFSINLMAQDSTGYQFKIREHIAPATCMFIAGMADGLRDAVIFHNDRVLSKLNVSERFWGPESWRNKYKNGDPAHGRRFPGSRTWLVWTTDAPHLLKFTDNIFTSGAIAIKLGQRKRKWYIYLAEGIGYWVINRVGFSLVYNRF